MNIEQILEQADNYFIGQLIEGNFECIDTSESTITVSMTKSDYTFTFWLSSKYQSLETFDNVFTDKKNNPVNLNFTDREKETLHTLFTGIRRHLEVERIEGEIKALEGQLENKRLVKYTFKTEEE